MKTLKNFSQGILGAITLLIGFFSIFLINPLFGLLLITTGMYLKYKSNHYVHH